MKLSFDVSDAAEERYENDAIIDGWLKFRYRPFESACFGNKSAEILEWETHDFPVLFHSFLLDKEFIVDDFCYLRLHSADIQKIKQAEAAGFYFIESSIIPYLQLKTWNREAFIRYIKPMMSVTSETFPVVEQIARSTFRGLRFNLDSNIGDERADKRYLTWLRNARDNNEDILVMEHRDRIIGFSLLRFEGTISDASPRGDRVVYRLAGIHPDFKNAGLGMMLYASTVAYSQDQGAKHIDGGFSVANVPVLNIMSNLGFLYRDPTVVLHYYVI